MLFTLSGSIGLSAVMSKNECLALLFGYITLNLMVLFTCLGIGLIIFKSIYYFLINIGSIVSDLENACTEDESWVSEIDAIYELGDTIMCSSLCPCTATQDEFTNEDAPEIYYDPNGATTIDECPVTVLTAEEYEEYYELL